MRWLLLNENASSLHNGQVGMPIDEDVVRAAAIEGVRQRTLDGRVPITRTAHANDFGVGGSRFPLIDRGRGIRKPRNSLSGGGHRSGMSACGL
jgi:hypothetical protein